MSLDSTASLFVMLGQTAEKTISKLEDVVPKDTLLISKDVDLALLAPGTVRKAVEASEPYKLFFFFETYLREMIVDALSKEGTEQIGTTKYRKMCRTKSLNWKKPKR